MELLDHQQVVRKRLPLCRQEDFIARSQPQQYVTGPACPTLWLALRMAIPWAIIICAIVAILVTFGPSNQTAIEATLRVAGILVRCFYRLLVVGEHLLSELIADLHAINASFE